MLQKLLRILKLLLLLNLNIYANPLKEYKNSIFKPPLSVGAAIESGMAFISLSKLANSLENNSLFSVTNKPPLCTSLYGFRIFLHSSSPWLAELGIIGASQSVITGSNAQTAIAEARMNFLGSHILIGYSLFKHSVLLTEQYWQGRKPYWQVYPFAALNLGRQQLRIWNYTSEIERIGQIEKVPALPARPLYLNSTCLQIETGIGTQFFTDRKKGALIGVELGGTFSPLATSWKDSKASGKTTDLPTHLMNGFFFRITFGIARTL
ncbi:MAG: hypothetical protein RML72_09275 [Bacteroidia bacterium]|nr:hypothetical protein [Bacteroidia bacterium]MDW8159048.1 hypothetical protein [Bacteroidia bacterium]